MTRYDDVLDDLRTAYDRGAEGRDKMPKAEWKVAERQAFGDRLREAGAKNLIELGAGTGHDALFFQENGLDVVATDLSAAMVQRCRAKGLEAHVMDFMHLDFAPASFDAAFAVNSLLHVPNADLPDALTSIRTILRPGALFYLGVYGSDEAREGPATHDEHVPPRFFSWRTDEQIQGFALASFEILDFHVMEVSDDLHFQSLTLRARP